MWTNQLKCNNANNVFFTHFVSSQICDDRVNEYFFTQMMSYTMRYDVIYSCVSSLLYQFSTFEDVGGWQRSPEIL